jgi:hypothetical protein
MSSASQTPAPSPVQVDPARLRRCGKELRQIAEQLAGDVSAHRSLTSAGHGAEGWQVGTTARRAAQEWGESLLALVDRLDVLGQSFVAAADSYAGTDSRAAARSGEVRVR